MNLTRIQRPWLVTSCEWNDKLIRSAIVWLCQLTGKPILKLTNKDYNENGLSELLALFGSAYNVNIKIFNDLQHTITGWPGGKPNADDTYRPERAKPYPKRVVIFSPHPDDDVISMGGTLRRLVEQKHEVHVAYETSGNIAVGDDTPSTQAMANPHTPSMNVMQVAGQRVGHEMIAERTICVGEETIVTGGWAASTQTCQMSSSATTVTTVGQCLHACRRGRSV